MKTSNVDINRENKEVNLIIDTKFYGYYTVLQAAKDYCEVCWVLVDGNKEDKLLVNIKPKTDEVDLDKVGYEFYNYLLGLMQNAIFTLPE